MRSGKIVFKIVGDLGILENLFVGLYSTITYDFAYELES
jgi:hypothetical protein